MIALTPAALTGLMTHIVNTAHGCTDSAGEPLRLGTMSESQLRTAAITALMIATGEVVYPTDLGPIKTRAPRAPVGVIEVQAG